MTDTCPPTLRTVERVRASLTPDQIETILEALESDSEYWRTIADPPDMDKVAKINAAAEAFRKMTEGEIGSVELTAEQVLSLRHLAIPEGAEG